MKRRRAPVQWPVPAGGRRQRSHALDRVMLVIGSAFILLGAVSGMRLLRTQEEPDEVMRGMGVKPPRPVKHAGETFTLGVGVRARGCASTVDVRVVVYGTLDYWATVAGEERSSFSLLVPSRIRDVSARLGRDSDDVLAPLEAAAGEKIAVRRRAVSPEGTVVTGTIPKWTQKTDPVLVDFKADWIERRGLATCYLRLPALTGRPSLFAAQQMDGLVSEDPAEDWGEQLVWREPTTGRFALVDPTKELVHGNATVDVVGGEVSRELSTPAPDRQYRGRDTWSCDREPEPPDMAVPGTSTPAYKAEQMRTQLASDCSATVVITLDRAEFWRDLVLILIGTVVSIGTTIVLEVLLHWRFARLGSRSAT